MGTQNQCQPDRDRERERDGATVTPIRLRIDYVGCSTGKTRVCGPITRPRLAPRALLVVVPRRHAARCLVSDERPQFCSAGRTPWRLRRPARRNSGKRRGKSAVTPETTFFPDDDKAGRALGFGSCAPALGGGTAGDHLSLHPAPSHGPFATPAPLTPVRPTRALTDAHTLSPAHAQLHLMMNALVALMLLVSASAHLLTISHRSACSSRAPTPTMVDPEIQLPPGVPIVDLSLDVRARRKGGLGWGTRGV